MSISEKNNILIGIIDNMHRERQKRREFARKITAEANKTPAVAAPTDEVLDFTEFNFIFVIIIIIIIIIFFLHKFIYFNALN